MKFTMFYFHKWMGERRQGFEESGVGRCVGGRRGAEAERRVWRPLKWVMTEMARLRGALCAERAMIGWLQRTNTFEIRCCL